MSRLFWGIAAGMKPLFKLTSKEVNAFTLSPTPAWAYFSLLSDGTHTTSATGLSPTTYDGEWMGIPGAFSGGDFEVRVTQTGTVGAGTLTGTLGSWLALSSNRTWELTTTDNSFCSRTFTVEIRRITDSFVVATATITLSAESTI